MKRIIVRSILSILLLSLMLGVPIVGRTLIDHELDNTRIHNKTQSARKIQINEINYVVPGEDASKDEYIELYVVEGGFDPSYWYATDWDTNNYWEIPPSCPVVSTGEFIVLHLGSGSNDNIGPIYHFYMNETVAQLGNQGEPLTLFQDDDSSHERGSDSAHDFVAYGTFVEDELTDTNPWCDWPNNGDAPIDFIEPIGADYESLQLIGNDLDNHTNWWSSKPTLGNVNDLKHQYFEDFEEPFYQDTTLTSATGWGDGSLNLSARGIGELIFPVYEFTVYGLFIGGDYVYVATDNRGIAIFDISDPNNPGEPNYYAFDQRIDTITGSGNYLYFTTSWDQLGIMDISTPTNPGTPEYLEFNTNNANCGDIVVSGDYAYITTYQGGLVIIDISDPHNPGQPIYQGINGDRHTSVFVLGDYAYVTCESGNFTGLAIIEISDPTDPGDPIYVSIDSGDADDVYVSGDYAYIGASRSGLAIVDVSDPTNPGQPTYYFMKYPHGVFIRDNVAYVAAESRGLAILDISDPINPKPPIYRDIEYIYNVDYIKDENARNVVVSGDYAYVTCSQSVAIIRVTNLFDLPSSSIAQTVPLCDYVGLILNVTVNANQTVYPNTSIKHYVSFDANIWSFTPLNQCISFDKTNNAHTLFWRAVLEVEEGQNKSPLIDSITIDIGLGNDDVPPTISILSPTNSTYLTDDILLNFSIDETTNWIGYSLDGTDNVTTSRNIVLLTSLSEGSHSIVIFARDRANNMGKSLTIWFTFLDNVSPTLKVYGLQNNIHYSGNLVIKGTITDTSELSYVELSITNNVEVIYYDSEYNLSLITMEANNWTFSVSIDTTLLSNGEYNVYIQVSDEHGNLVTTVYSIIIDNPTNDSTSSDAITATIKSFSNPISTPSFHFSYILLGLLLAATLLRRR